MANKKSSITAQIKVAGLNSFKSDLATAGKSAVDLGTRLQTIKPLSFEGEGQRARKARAMREEHHRASTRVIERNEKTHQARMAALGPKYAASYQAMSGGGKGDARGAQGKGGGGLSGGGNLAQGYNFVQDLVQGGPMAVANNIPWLVTAVAQAWKSPLVVAAAGLVGSAVAAAASVGLAAYIGYDVFTKDSQAFERSAKNRSESKKKWDKINSDKEKKDAKDLALSLGQIEGETQKEISQGVQRKTGEIKGESSYDRAAELQSELRQARIDAIIDPEEKAKAAAEEEKKQIDLSIISLKTKADQVRLMAQAELKIASEKKKAITEELALQNENTAPTPEELNRRIQLEATLVNVSKRKADAEGMVFDAIEQTRAANQKSQEAVVQKKIIETKAESQIKGIKTEKDTAKLEEEKKNNEERDQRLKEEASTQKSINEKVIEDHWKAKEEADAQGLVKQKVRDQMAAEERKSRMSPRRLAKEEAKERIQGQTEELVKQGFLPDEAASMAKGQENRRGRKQTDLERAAAGLRPRIRGAGYGDETKEAGGLGSAKFTGLEGLAAMQPAVKERKRIQGAGAKKKEAQPEGQQEGGWQTLVNAMMQVKAAVEKIAPNASERGKPSSSGSR